MNLNRYHILLEKLILTVIVFFVTLITMPPRFVIGDSKNLTADTVWKLGSATPSVKEATQIVFDWDDTLLHSSWLSDAGYKLPCTTPLPQSISEDCAKLTKMVIRLIKRAKKYARVMIITAADNWWVKACMEKFMPELVPYMNGIDVISARKYQKAYTSSIDWKRATFRDELHKDYLRNILSIGDGIPEQEAMRSLGCPAGVLTKIVKLLPEPKVEVLIAQLENVIYALPDLLNSGQNLDLKTGVADVPISPMPPQIILGKSIAERKRQKKAARLANKIE